MVAVTDDLLSAFTWQKGAGGYICGIEFGADGSMWCKPDTWGVYYRANESLPWQQMLTVTSMPAAIMALERQYQGCALSIAVAPSNPDIVYIDVAGYVIKTVNRGATFAMTAFPYKAVGTLAGGNNGVRRLWGKRLVVDPINPNVVYRGYYGEKIQVSHDGGATVFEPASFPTCTAVAQGNSGVCGVVVDASSATISGRKSRVLANSFGNGWQESTDGGVTFAPIAGSVLTGITRACLDSVGTLWVCDGTANLRKYAGGTWTTYTPGVNAYTIAVYPGDNNRIIVFDIGNTGRQTSGGGSSWSSNLAPTRDADGDVYWHHNSVGPWFSLAEVVWHPTTPDELWLADGIGVHKATVTSSHSTSIAWKSRSRGIEQLVGSSVCKPPNNVRTFLSTHDKELWDDGNPDRLARNHVFRFEHNVSLNTGFFVEYCYANPRLLLCSTVALGRVSRDGGKSWKPFTSPPWRRGASSKTNCMTSQAGSAFIDIDISFLVDGSLTGHFNNTAAEGTFWFTSSVTFDGLTLNGRYPCTYPDNYTVRINAGAPASVGISSGGGTINYRLSYGDYTSSGCRFMPGPQVRRYIPLTDNIWLAEGGQGCGNFYTLDGGQWWEPIVFPDGAPDTDFSAFNALQARRIIAADGGNPMKAIICSGFAVYSLDFSGGGAPVVTKVKTTPVEGWTYYSNRVHGVPGVEGVFFFTGGQVTGITPGYPANAFSITRDGGATWTRVADALEVWCMDWGPIAPGSTVPSLGMTGWLNGTFGIYEVRDWAALNSSTWQWYRRHDGYPNGEYDYIQDMGRSKEDPDLYFLVLTGICGKYLARQKFSDQPMTVQLRLARA